MPTPKKFFWENDRFMRFMEFLEKAVFAVGIPLSIYTYIDDTQKERDEHEYFVYDTMDKHYEDYEKFAAAYPLLGMSDAVVGDSTLTALIKPDSARTPQEKIIARQLGYQLIGLFERAYLLYANSDKKSRQEQWQGWKDDLVLWLHQKRFMDTWRRAAGYFDLRFENYVNQLIREMNIS